MEGYMSEIRMFAGNFAPKSWAYCQAQQLAISTNQALFSLLGTVYGGNGVQTFGLPDLRGRVAVGTGNGGGLTPRILGNLGGINNTTLITNNMPAHTHTATFAGSGGSGGNITSSFNVSTKQADQSTPGAGSPAANALAAPYYNDGVGAAGPEFGYVNDPAASVLLKGLSVTATGGGGSGGTVTNQLTGSGLPMSTMQPYLGINYIICLYGIFPSRN
jgi:microcystin-dependent protein